MIIVAALVVLGGGGAAAFMLMDKGDDKKALAAKNGEATPDGEETGENGEEQPEFGVRPKNVKSSSGDTASDTGGTSKKSKKGAEEEEEDSASSKYGQTYPLKPFNLNLGNPLENRYIRLVIAVEFRGGDAQREEITAKEPKIRDIVVSLATKKTMEFLLGPDGKDHLRHELFVTINQSLEQKLEAVYITDMLIE